MTSTRNAIDLFRSVDAAVKAHAALRPDAPALLATERATCTYRDLAAHLDRLAAVLVTALPADNRIIAVAAANGPELFTAIVAAMSGGICSPFDPNRPTAEIESYLADIKPALVLADEAVILRHRDAFERYGVGVLRMLAAPGAPAGVFDVRVEPSRQLGSGPSGHPNDAAMLMRTSGTTSAAKIIPHTMPRLMHLFTTVVDALNLQSTDRCLNARPLHHGHAINSILGPSLVAGASVVFPAEIGAAALVDSLQNDRPTWYAASPPIHRDVLAYTRRAAEPIAHSLRFVRSASARLDRQLALDLEAALGVPVLESYGTTEAPGIALNPPPPHTRKLGSVGRSLGCEIAIVEGEITVRGANAAPAYADGRPIVDPVTGWYHTGDAGYLDDDGYLFITGRLNEIINVGGEKVAPGNVERALCSHPAVEDVVAFPLPHPTLGQHVAAAVVPRAGATVTARELIAHAAQLLPRPAVPNVVHLVPSIARDTSGKARRRDLEAMFARDTQPVPRDPSEAPDDAMLPALVRIWEDVLEYAPVLPDENFFAAGGDSWRAIRVITMIEAELDVTLSADTLLYAPTVRELAQAVRAQTNGARRDRIVPLRATGSRPPLFFYDSDVKGGGLYARFLSEALDADQPIYVVRPYGAFGDPIPESIEAMAAADAAMIAAAVPSQTYRLAGFCSGGTIAFEVARRLEGAGSNVDTVALIASSAPNASLEPLWALSSRATTFLSQRGKVLVYKGLRSIANAIRTRSAPTEILTAINQLRHPLPRPEPVDRIYSDRHLRYFPKPTARSIDLIWGNEDQPRLSGDPTMGWRHVARVRRHSVGGDHTTVLTEHLDEVGAVLRRILDSADHGRLED